MSDYYFIEPQNWEIKLKRLITYLKNPDKPIVIFVSGPAGIGKSSVSVELCQLLGIRNYICTDTLRILLASQEVEKPLLEYFSHECWKYLGEFSKENLIKGFHKQSEFICDGVDWILKDALRHKKNTLIEGIHLLPSIILKRSSVFNDLSMVFVYITSDFQFFKTKLLPNRVVSTYRHRKITDYDEDRLAKFEIFHNMWKDELYKYGIRAIDNSSSPEILVEKIINLLIDEIEGK